MRSRLVHLDQLAMHLDLEPQACRREPPKRGHALIGAAVAGDVANDPYCSSSLTARNPGPRPPEGRGH